MTMTSRWEKRSRSVIVRRSNVLVGSQRSWRTLSRSLKRYLAGLIREFLASRLPKAAAMTHTKYYYGIHLVHSMQRTVRLVLASPSTSMLCITFFVRITLAAMVPNTKTHCHSPATILCSPPMEHCGRIVTVCLTIQRQSTLSFGTPSPASKSIARTSASSSA
ncbi:hypothetical protein DFH94DRAFT_80293 [Russula ochroleuca]|uniref:Uncharacterized protein n=1 Tax=Russula ochroleuca TaxID=152965 RepID=A0A9P5T721_9AGAM|nr:hypothetical protein DFH94DRAFT_80293 [Russula ochroleuca]